MSKPKIPGGYIMLPRAKHPIDEMPSLYRDVWIYILKKVSHKDDVSKGYKRGECLISIPEIQEALTYYVGFKKVTPTKHQIDNIIRWLRKTNTYDALYDNGYDVNTTMITTTRTTRGMVVKVCGYAFLQDSKNYEYDSTNDNENGTYTKRVRQQPDTIYKNVKELKNDNNDKNVVVYDDNNDNLTASLNLYIENIEADPKQITINKFKNDFQAYGSDIMNYAIEKSTLGKNKDYKFINWLLKDWDRKQLTSIEDIREYEERRESNNDTSKELTPNWLTGKQKNVNSNVSEEGLEKMRKELIEELNKPFDEKDKRDDPRLKELIEAVDYTKAYKSVEEAEEKERQLQEYKISNNIT